MRLVAMSCMALGPLDERQEVARRGAPLARWVCASLGTVALALAGASHAAGLFLPVGPAGATADVAPAAKATPTRRSAAGVADAWERRVRVARHELTAARADVETAGAGRLLLNVRDGVRLDVVVERTASTRWGYSLSGRVVGGGAGFATLVVHDEAVAGSIWTPDSAYELAYLGGGVHALRDVTNAQLVECAGAVPVEPSAAEAAAQSDADDDSVVVDILVVWTPAMEVYDGGERATLSRIDSSIAVINDLFERSGALVSLNLVGAERVDYSESGDNRIDFDRLADPDDGHMDGVHDRRDALGADLVHLQATGPLGAASFLGAFSVNALPHEVGHNFGILHERGEFFGAGGSSGNYIHGFTTAGCENTIMSYGVGRPSCRFRSAKRIPYYGSPWRYTDTGRALGVSRFSKERGLRGPADAVLTLNRNRHRVANFRPSRNGG